MKDENAGKDAGTDTDKPEQKQDGQGTDQAPDRTQSELTEENLLAEKHREANTPEERDKVEDELEEMEEDIQEANDR